MATNKPPSKPKGELPHKAGRPAGSKNKLTAQIVALAQSFGPDAIDTLADIMMTGRNPPASRVAAAKELLDRGFGKATQFIAGIEDAPISFSNKIDYTKLDKATLKALKKAIVTGVAPKDDGGDD